MTLELTPLDPELLPAAVAKVLSGPGPAKLMVARGLAPMGARDLALALYQLSLDGEAQVAEAAKKTAGSLPQSILGPALAEALAPRVLHFFALCSLDKPPLLEAVLLNRATTDETFEVLAARIEGQSLEILAGNQERLLRRPAIIEAIYFNRNARHSTVQRLLEMAVRNGLTLERIPQFQEMSESILGPALSSETGLTEEEAAAVDATFQQTLQQGDGEEAQAECGQEEGLANLNLMQVGSLPIVAKIRLAAVGSPLHRSILIKDSNKLVAMATIKSPAVSEQEASRYAANRQLMEEVISYIARKKTWQNSYAIKLALVNNPKCPMVFSMRFLSHLRLNDLRALSRSKNVSSALAKAAKETMRKRGG